LTLIFFLLTRWTARTTGAAYALRRLSVRCAGIYACDQFAQLLMEVAGRMCRQLICNTGLRLQPERRSKSIKQIEISRVIWKYHLPPQMATN
jgi:hypothetical protein